MNKIKIPADLEGRGIFNPPTGNDSRGRASRYCPQLQKIKRGQAWGFDLIIASTIFTMGIIIFFIYSLNLSDNTEEILNNLNYAGNSIADNLLSEGSPLNWNSTNVKKIGLTSDNKINETKLERFYSLSIADYEKTKSLFNTKYDYYIFFPEPMIINSNSVEGIGNPPVDPKNLIKVSRITIYNNKPTTLSIDIWD